MRATVRDNRVNHALSVLDGRSPSRPVDVVDALLADYPDDAEVLMLAARVALSHRESSDVAPLLARAEAAGVGEEATRALAAEVAMAERRYADAAEYHRGVLAQNPSGSRALAAHCRLGDALDRTGDKEGAKRAYLDGLKVDPDNAPAWYGVAKLELEAGEAAQAIVHATHAVSLVHAFPEGHYLLGRALLAAGRPRGRGGRLGRVRRRSRRNHLRCARKPCRGEARARPPRRQAARGAGDRPAPRTTAAGVNRLGPAPGDSVEWVRPQASGPPEGTLAPKGAATRADPA